MTNKLWSLDEIAEYSSYGMSMARRLVAPQPELVAACRIVIEYPANDPTQVYVAPMPDNCAPGFEVALLSVLLAFIRMISGR